MSTWMVVEDEPNIYELLMTMFQMWGIDGKAFIDGEAALAWIEDVDAGRYKGELPELALLDIRLPGAISGPMVGERIRRSPYLKQIAIVLTTAYTMSHAEEDAVILRADADKLVYKPLPTFPEFRVILETVIAERRARGGSPTVPPAERIIRPILRPATYPRYTTNRPAFTPAPPKSLAAAPGTKPAIVPTNAAVSSGTPAPASPAPPLPPAQAVPPTVKPSTKPEPDKP